MISIARTFGAPLTVPAGNVARSTSIGAAAVGEVARDLAREVHHVRVALERHQLLDLLGAELHDAADVVAGEVDEHHVLGALLRVLDRARPRGAGRAPRVRPRRRVPAIGRLITRPSEHLHHRLGRRARRSSPRDGAGSTCTATGSRGAARGTPRTGRPARPDRSAARARPGRCRPRGCAPSPPRPRLVHTAPSTFVRTVGQLGELVGRRQRGHVRQRAAELGDRVVEARDRARRSASRSVASSRPAAGTRSRSG